MDPYRVLNVPKTVTMEELKRAYRDMAFKTHPDRGGSDALFDLVTSSFKTIFKRLKLAESDKTFEELKRGSRKDSSTQPPRRRPIASVSDDQEGGDESRDFSIEAFNRLFDQHRLPDVHRDTGHGDFLKTAETKQGGRPANMSQFHDAFVERTARDDAKSKHLVLVREPTFVNGTGAGTFVELGVQNVEDFSGDNRSRKTLHFSDVALAHTTSRIVDPKTVTQRRAYKSIEDVETDRALVSYDMSPEQRAAYDERLREERMADKARIDRQRERDERAYKLYDDVHRSMLMAVKKNSG